MDARERLLERIGSLVSRSEARNQSRFEQVGSSIRAHLSRILRTRRKSVPIADDFGVPDLSNVAGSFEAGSSVEIVRAILETVGRYEPRLLSPRVRAHETTTELGALRLEISGEILVNGQNMPIQFPVLVKASGEVVLT
jgi:type VI secretion system protein|uniref:GPW/gp25 family protein n=1 Tax=Leptospirillum ferrodiazotrophum TaxID=412449 RepID=C6HYF2_9BACT|nr:MAG: GPW/gp25 family protein [Leptospirillum ferrodiazotrophum]